MADKFLILVSVLSLQVRLIYSYLPVERYATDLEHSIPTHNSEQFSAVKVLGMMK